MKDFGYKNYLTKSLIKESKDDISHNKIIFEFLTTMRYGNLPLMDGIKDIYINSSENHISFYIVKDIQSPFNTSNNEKYKNITFVIYTLSFDSLHTDVSFDIEENTANMDDTKFRNMFSTVIKYTEINEYCNNLIKSLKLLREQNNQTLEKQLYNEIYNKSTRLQEFDIETSTDNSGVSNPNFIKPKGIQFKPQDIIGDALFRSITDTKQKAESSIINWQKTQYTSKQENINTISCDIILKSLENSVSNNMGKTIEISKEGLGSKYDINNDEIDVHKLGLILGVYPVELYSPLVLLSMDDSIEWGKEGDQSSKEILNYLFGQDSFKNAKISYGSVGGELTDSDIAIPLKTGKYKKIGISSKGGVTSKGEGAAASLISIFKLIFSEDIHKNKKVGNRKIYQHIFSQGLKDILKSSDIEAGFKNFVSSYCSELGKKMFELRPTQMSILILFGGTNPKSHEKLINYLQNKKIFNLTFKPDASDRSMVSQFCHKINDNHNMTDLIMEILNNQKYDFAQMNCLPTVTKTTVSYKWKVQYPAHFNGTVKLEKRQNGVGFHIYG